MVIGPSQRFIWARVDEEGRLPLPAPRTDALSAHAFAAATRAAAASRNKIASTPMSTTDPAHTMINFLVNQDFLGDATEVVSFFIMNKCNRSLLCGMKNICQR